MTTVLDKLTLMDYINLAIHQNYLIAILVTSSAEAKIKSLGMDYGAGKSTEAMHICNYCYGYNWEKVKNNMIALPYELKAIFDRPYVTNAVLYDDMQATLGKDKQYDPEVRELAYYMTTIRPYLKVFIATAPHRGMLQKDFREFFHFEIIVPFRGTYEVQKLKHWIDYKNPTRMKDRLQYKGEGPFLSLPSEMQKWYDGWRHKKNKEIRSRLSIFQDEPTAIVEDLNFEDLSPNEQTIMVHIAKFGSIRYETLWSRHQVGLARGLVRLGWLEKRRRYFMLTTLADQIMRPILKQGYVIKK